MSTGGDRLDSGRPSLRQASRWLGSCLLAWTVSGCALEPNARTGSSAASTRDAAVEVDQGFSQADGRPTLCQREVESSDAVRELFCESSAAITGLNELKRLLTNTLLKRELTSGLVEFPLLLGHSTSLSGRYVSSINPRAISIVAGGGPLLTFTRGVQQVELTVMTRDERARRFYLLRFTQACNQRAEGCQPGDLYTPQVEQNWLQVELADDEQLKNTSSDCRQCHQRARSSPILLMRELFSPWTHFFEPISQEESLRALPGTSNSELTRDYAAARGAELYAGANVERLMPSGASLLQLAVGAEQPVFFSSHEILNERWPRTAQGEYPAEPQPSALWENAYAAFKRGEQLALPYVEQRATDPDKLAARTAAYAAYRAGTLPAEELPDLADVFPDDPLLRARIGLQTEPDAAPVDTLIQGCGACHNDVLDQTLTRARFNIDLARMPAQQLDRAIERLLLQPGEGGAMPPPEARQLDPSGKTALIEYLRTAARSGEPVPALVHAAQVGMTGGSPFTGVGSTVP